MCLASWTLASRTLAAASSDRQSSQSARGSAGVPDGELIAAMTTSQVTSHHATSCVRFGRHDVPVPGSLGHPHGAGPR